MTYEAKPGSFSLFKNDKKTKDNHPDYKGDGKDLDGNPIWVNAWLKESSRGKFMSCAFTLKSASQPRSKSVGNGRTQQDDDDTPPF
jgi:hypothetical protein